MPALPSEILFSRNDDETYYTHQERDGVVCIAMCALASISSILYAVAARKLRYENYRNTHVFVYLSSLLFANTIQSLGTMMNFRWVGRGGLVSGNYCSLQGGVKQAGNIATALWSFMIAMHLFNLLFLRVGSTRLGLFLTLFMGWAVVVIFVLVGPSVIETADRGPYFGISGAWCWITSRYRLEQIFLEYFLEFCSAGLGFILYIAVLLRVRGNIIYSQGKFRVRTVPSGQGWQLAIGRDFLSSAMFAIAKNMVWYPVLYSAILLPISIGRLMKFAGHRIPFWVEIFADCLFNLTGCLNVVLLVYTDRLFAQAGSVEFRNQRPISIDLENLAKTGGVTPFTLARSDTAAKYREERVARLNLHLNSSGSSGSRTGTTETTDSGYESACGHR
ncbi:hypothetical protein EV122DRAFT_204671 [Schizophyllum commune]